MIANCSSCGTLWTNSGVKARVIPTRMPKQTCPDCRDFDWPNTTKRNEIASKSMAKPGKDKK